MNMNDVTYEVGIIQRKRGGGTQVAALLERAYGGLTSGDPGGVRTRDLSLERAAS
jgi:hypothetical protein